MFIILCHPIRDILKSKKSIYDVSIEFQNADPLGLVNYAIDHINGANQVWIVFDVDNTHKDNRLIPAINKAEKNGIKYAFSNVSFEVWLVSHFEIIEKEMTETKLENVLSEYLSKEKAGLTYQKNEKDSLKEYWQTQVFVLFYPISNEKMNGMLFNCDVEHLFCSASAIYGYLAFAKKCPR